MPSMIAVTVASAFSLPAEQTHSCLVKPAEWPELARQLTLCCKCMTVFVLVKRQQMDQTRAF